MSRELTGFYRSLAEDTDPRGLAAPDLVRRYADRRARTRAALGVLAVAALVGGTAVGAQTVLSAAPDTRVGPPADTPAPPSPTPVPSQPTPSPSTSSPGPSGSASRQPPSATRVPPPARTPTSIPDSAFFALAAANDTGAGAQFDEGRVLPALCGAEPGASGIVRQRTRSFPVKLTGTPDDYVVPDLYYRHSITIYRDGGAAATLDDLRAAVRECPQQQLGDVIRRQKLLPSSGYGEESVLFEVRGPYQVPDGGPTGEVVNLVRAIRIGSVVTVLWDQGWEGSSTTRSQFDADSRRAVAAIRDWLR
ncbi:hypothetical protein V6U89_03540 [Micromonospora sp. CPCC 206171]|uniref:hypothetical protein n=1 Tax=Micromonospora sp. CPCC 206171 TaxID=3122405 RepID=UPI002FF21DCD